MTMYREDSGEDLRDDEVGFALDDPFLPSGRSARLDRTVAIDRRPPDEPLMGAALDLVHDLDQQVAQLKTALQSNRRIGIATGIVMSQLRMSDEDAFAALRRVSQNRNRKLHDVAEDVIYAGHLTLDH